MKILAQFGILFGMICAPTCMNGQSSYNDILEGLTKQADAYEGTVLDQQLDDLYEAYCRENDPVYDITNEINRRFRLDQGLRLMVASFSDSKDEKVERQRAWARNKMNEMDRDNAKWCDEVLDKHGFPSYDEFGNETSDHFWNILQHVTDPLVLAKGIREMKKEVDKKQATAWEYAYLVDRLALNNCEPQTYGTQHIGKFLVPLKNVNLVDHYRAHVGLGPVEEEMRADFDPDFTWEKYEATLAENWQTYRNRFGNSMTMR